MLLLFTLSLLYFAINKTAARLCNGVAELCDLDITKITLAGSHNSGAGYDGILYYHSLIGKSPAGSCFYRNQEKDFTAQLDLGIRYFDIDACWENQYQPNSAWICHSNAYAGPISKMLFQINNWMNDPKNRNEVIVIHFNRDYDKSNQDLTAKHIIKMLSDNWEPSSYRKSHGLLTMQPNLYVKLGDAINRNQRVYVIMHPDLSAVNPQSWLISEHTVGYTWTSKSWSLSNGCLDLINEMGEERCSKEAYHPLVRYDLYLSSGLCTGDMASSCNKHIDRGVELCYKGTLQRRGTVNFLVVDYVDQQVVDVARKQNIKNVKFYLGKDI